MNMNKTTKTGLALRGLSFLGAAIATALAPQPGAPGRPARKGGCPNCAKHGGRGKCPNCAKHDH